MLKEPTIRRQILIYSTSKAKWWIWISQTAAIVGLSEYIKQDKDRLTRLMQEYDAGKTKYSLLKEAN
jgi:hypothetical protein